MWLQGPPTTGRKSASCRLPLVDFRCQWLRLLICSDEMYRWLELEPAARLPAAADAYERGISLTGCSKATGGPGLRIGWVATRDAAREAWLPALEVLHQLHSEGAGNQHPSCPQLLSLLACFPLVHQQVLFPNNSCRPAALAVLGRILELKDYTTICSSAPSEVLALIMLRK